MWALLYLPTNVLIKKMKYTDTNDFNFQPNPERVRESFYTRKECEKFRRAVLVWLKHYVGCLYRDGKVTADKMPPKKSIPSFLKKRNRTRFYTLSYATSNYVCIQTHYDCISHFCIEEWEIVKIS